LIGDDCAMLDEPDGFPPSVELILNPPARSPALMRAAEARRRLMKP